MSDELPEPETVLDIANDMAGLPRDEKPEMDFIEQAEALEMPRIDGTPDEPALGIHFGMPEEVYHALPAFNNSGAKELLASPTIYWAGSWMNPRKEEKDAEHYRDGKAYHAMILEGPKAYDERFYAMPDPDDYPDALVDHTAIKEAIKKAGDKPVTKVPDGEGTRNARKIDHAHQLHRLDPRIHIWDIIVEKAVKRAASRTMIKSSVNRQIHISARMIMRDPDLARAFKGGWPEVVIVWRDPRQGVLCKMRADYLKLKAIVDLKTYQNSQRRSTEQAILRSIAETRLTLQPAHYIQGLQEGRKLVRAHGASAVHFHEDRHKAEQLEWIMRWAQFEGEDSWLWVFQQKGESPITRGYWFRMNGTHYDVACMNMVEAVRRFRHGVETYGTDPWLDIEPIGELDDEKLLDWGMEI